MGNIPANHPWRKPLADLSQVKPLLKNGFLEARSAAALVSRLDPLELVPFVRDDAWLSRVVPMRASALGADRFQAEAIGSTILLQIDGHQLLIDPGDKVHFESASPDVIVLTHAHHDHVGGLLEAALRYPRARIVATPDTFALLQKLPEPVASQVSALIEDRGCIQEADGSSFRMNGMEFRLLPAGHLIGACMLDLSHGGSRALITGDFALRAIAGKEGAVWPDAEYDLLVMEATHAWDREAPTADVDTNRNGLLVACQSAVEHGHTRLLVEAKSLGEAQEVYAALCEAQMKGDFGRYSIHIRGKGAEVARLYQRQNRGRLDPWSGMIHALDVQAEVPEMAISIGGAREDFRVVGGSIGGIAAESPRHPVAFIALGQGLSRDYPFAYEMSLHASLGELLATGLAIKAGLICLYHGNVTNASQTPLGNLLMRAGRKVASLGSRRLMIGDSK